VTIFEDFSGWWPASAFSSRRCPHLPGFGRCGSVRKHPPKQRQRGWGTLKSPAGRRHVGRATRHPQEFRWAKNLGQATTGRQVKGHDLGRAVIAPQINMGFSPWKPQGLKPSNFLSPLRHDRKSCPFTCVDDLSPSGHTQPAENARPGGPEDNSPGRKSGVGGQISVEREGAERLSASGKHSVCPGIPCPRFSCLPAVRSEEIIAYAGV